MQQGNFIKNVKTEVNFDEKKYKFMEFKVLRNIQKKQNVVKRKQKKMSTMVSTALENNKEDGVNEMLVTCEFIIKPVENAELDIKHDS